MTRDEILAMEAGEELDGLIAQNIMGIKKYYPGIAMDLSGIDGKVKRVNYWWCKDVDNSHNSFTELHHYSTDISVAWEVVEKMGSLGYYVTIEELRPYRQREDYLSMCTITKYEEEEDKKEWNARADNAPEAISKAALLAVMEEE